MKINVKVTTKAKKEGIEYDLKLNLYKVKISAVPVDGRANKELIECLANYFKVKKSSVKIVCGESSKTKIIEIDRV